MFFALSESLKTERSLASIRSNILAGLTVGVIALPLSMALAIAVGVPPQHGLYTAMIAGIVSALTGGSRSTSPAPRRRSWSSCCPSSTSTGWVACW